MAERADLLCPDCLRRVPCEVVLDGALVRVLGTCPKHGAFEIVRVSRCPHCGYHLAGIPACSACTECGRASSLLERAVDGSGRTNWWRGMTLLWPIVLGVGALVAREITFFPIDRLPIALLFGLLSGVNAGVMLARIEAARFAGLPVEVVPPRQRALAVRGSGFGLLAGAASVTVLAVLGRLIDLAL